MKVYTYCNYKGSLKGYQFAAFDWGDSCDEVKSLDAGQTKEDIPQEVVDWFWSRSGWKLVQTKGAAENGLLLIQGLEKARYFQREQVRERQEEMDLAAEIRGEEKAETIPLPKDSAFYINLCFEGQIDKLQQLAAAFVNELRTDGGAHLLDMLEKAFSEFELTNYVVDLSEFRKAITGMCPAKPSPVSSSPPSSGYSIRSILNRICPQPEPQPGNKR